MFWVTRIFELLSATKKLNDARPHVMSALSGLTLVILLSLFGAFLSALMIAGLLWFIYGQVISTGIGVYGAVLIITAVTGAILLAVWRLASAAFDRIRDDIERAFRSQAPIVAPVVNKVGDVAGAFMSGLRTSHGARHNAALKKAERPRR